MTNEERIAFLQGKLAATDNLIIQRRYRKELSDLITPTSSGSGSLEVEGSLTLNKNETTAFGGGGATSTSGPQAAKGIVAPPAGQRIVLTQLTIQNGSDVSMNIVLGGLGRTIVAPVNGSGIDWHEEIRLPEATAFTPDVSVAEPCHIAGHFYLEDVATGEPIQ